MEKLSIIVPVYNVVNYLEECVNSLLAQTYDNFEIILVNDGSTDGSGALCDRLATQNKKIKVIHQKNAGLPAARNAGLREADGNYIAFVDSDDRVAENMYELLVNKIMDSGSEMAICNFLIFNRNGTAARCHRYGNRTFSYSDDQFFACAMDSCCNRVYTRKSIADNDLWFEDKSIVAQEDYWFLVRYCTHIEKISSILDPLYCYRERSTSISKGRTDLNITERNLRFLTLSKDYISRNSDRRPEVFFQFQLLNMLFSAINNLPEINISKIKGTVKLFSQNEYYVSAISKSFAARSYPESDARSRYDRILLWLLRLNLYNSFALLETLRIKRLRSSKREDLYFD